MRKTLRKIWAFVLVEIIYAPKRFYCWLRGYEFAMRVTDVDGKILRSTKNAAKSMTKFDHLFDKM